MTGQSRRRPSPPVFALLVAAGVVVAQALLVPLFAGPAANLAPRDLPVIVAGPAPARAGFAAQLRAARPGAFDVAEEPDAAAADRALRDRAAYAAFVLGPGGAALHVASAASPTVASLLTQAAAELGGGRQVPVTDVVPIDPDDPHGAGLAIGFLPLALTGLFAGVLLALLVRPRMARVTGLVGYAVLAGLAGAAVLQYWLGVLPGSYPANAAVIALFSLATGATVAGLGAVLGEAGLGLGAVVVFLVGNALSGVSTAPELLPQPWGAVGQWLPVGAGGSLLRSVAYFDGAGAGRAAWILAGYAVIGLILVGVGRASARTALGRSADSAVPEDVDRDAGARRAAGLSAAG